MSTLAIFDLDHTLVDCDSDSLWPQYLYERGLTDAATAEKRQDFYRQYAEGVLDVDEFLRYQLALIARFPMDELAVMHREYMAKYITPYVRRDAVATVRSHFDAGDEVVLVSATNEFIIKPVARELFGIDNALGVSLETDDAGQYTGRYIGTPTFGAGKITRLREWLQARGTPFESFSHTVFYSDSRNDLPLLKAVNEPVAVCPDAVLEDYARNHGWRIEYWK